MPPRSAADITNHRINNLIGLFAVSVFFFGISWLLARGSSNPASGLLLWFFGLLGGASLAGWIVLSYRRLAR
ncbi:MAG: hypothetical protein V4795_09480 [Pseudomonadota bacterium]|jgi:lipid-A-disaccharide synthase-like uncharacterized protein